MIPLPDWSRLNPPQPPRSTLPSKGGCSDFSGCALGCGGTAILVGLAGWAAKAFGGWAGVGALLLGGILAWGAARVSKRLLGLLLGLGAAALIVGIMLRDYFNQPIRIAVFAVLAFACFAFAGHVEAMRETRG